MLDSLLVRWGSWGSDAVSLRDLVANSSKPHYELSGHVGMIHLGRSKGEPGAVIGASSRGIKIRPSPTMRIAPRYYDRHGRPQL